MKRINLKNFVLVLFFSTGLLKAQTDFKPGFILELSGDTLIGNIDYRGDLLMSNICKFKGADLIVRKFSPDDIIGYGFNNGKYFVSKKVGNKKVFLEYLIKGKVDIYYLRDKTGDHYFLDKEGIGLSELVYDEGVVMIDNKKILHKSTSHIGFLKYYMQDAPELESRIISVKKPEHQSLIKLAEEYHNAVCSDEKCIVYEKKIPVLKVSVAPYIGLTKYLGFDGFSFEYGSNVYFSLPRANEKLSIKTGISRSTIRPESQNVRVLKLPFQIQYMYPSEFIQPIVSAGYNLVALKYEAYNDLEHTVGLNAGVNFKINKTLGILTMISTEFTPFGFTVMNDDMNFGMVSYSFLLGLHINL